MGGPLVHQIWLFTNPRHEAFAQALARGMSATAGPGPLFFSDNNRKETGFEWPI